MITIHSPREVYDAYLEARSEDQGLNFDATPQMRAISRLCCLCRCFDKTTTAEVQAAYDQLSQSERKQLTQYLSQDGIEDRPGFHVNYLSSFLYEARRNPENAGIKRALRLLLRVYVVVEAEYYSTHRSVISISILDLVNWA